MALPQHPNKILRQADIRTFVDFLSQDHEVHLPVAGEKDVLFRKYDEIEFEQVTLEYTLAMYSFKHLFMPQKDVLFHYSPKGITVPEEKSKVIFGMHIEDIHMLNILDKALIGEFKEVNYTRRRALYWVIGISKDQLHEQSFTPFLDLDIDYGYDLFLQKMDNGDYLVAHGSKRAVELTDSLEIFHPTDLAYKEPRKPDPNHVLLNREKVRKAVDESISDPMWEEVASTCIGCGICTYVCPLCYCYDIKDENSLEAGCGDRCKTWDSCLHSSFTKVATGEVFREGMTQRFYNWHHHKFVRMPLEIGELGCTGCGRCTAYCPPKITLHDNLKRIVDKYGDQS